MSAQGGDLQFERAEFAEGQGVAAACAFCKQPFHGSYYQIGDQPACERCKLQLQFDRSSSSGFGRFARAGAFGFLAALAGSALWYAVRATTGYEVGLIAVVVGVMVGGAVRAGSRRRGGLLYQALAVALTYFGICAQYVPDVWKGLSQMSKAEETAQAPTGAAPPAGVTPAEATDAAPAKEPAVATSSATPEPTDGEAPTFPQFLLAIGLVLGIAFAAPLLGGFENIIGILIIGFALWEAWKLNKHEPLTISGPFRVGETLPAAPPASAAD